MDTSGFHHHPPAQGLYDAQAEHDACGVGFVVHIKGRRSHDIVEKALQVLVNLEHQGACGCEENTGDGAGILIQIPDTFLRKVSPVALPSSGEYGTGLVFLPHDEADRDRIKELIAAITEDEGQQLLGWRDVPTDNRMVGPSARATQPVFQQDLLEKVLERIAHLELPVMVGVLPLVSYKNAEFLHNEVPGMQIPEEIRERMRRTPGGEAARKEGVRIAREMLFAVRDRVQGAYLMPPLGRYELALEVLEGLKA